jgi:hypothetical protein
MYDRRYWREWAIWMLAYLALIVLTSALVRRLPDDSPWRIAAALPVCAVALAAFWSELRQVRRLDEMQRAIYLEASLAGSWSGIAIVATAALLEVFGGLPRLSPLWILLGMGLGFGAGYLNAVRRYR